MTRYLLFLLVTAGFTSCSKPSEKSETDDFQFSYQIDTVMVDSGDHFLFLNWALGISDLVEETHLLYNLNPNSLLLEEIDLENLRLKQTIQLEAEGPNGIGGGFVTGIEKKASGDLFFFDVSGLNQLKPDGTKVDKVLLDGEYLTSQGLPQDATLDIDGTVSDDGKILATPYQEVGPTGKMLGLALLTLDDLKLKLIPSDFLQYLEDFGIYMQENGMTRVSQPEQFYMQFDGEVIIFNTSAKNEAWVYDMIADSLFQRSFTSKLTSNAKKGNYEKITESMEAFQAEGKKKSSEVTFGPLIRDSERNLFWRFTTEGKTKVMSVFDENLNLLKEKQLPEDLKIGMTPYFMNGMIYQFINLEDEMGFVRLKPSIE